MDVSLPVSFHPKGWEPITLPDKSLLPPLGHRFRLGVSLAACLLMGGFVCADEAQTGGNSESEARSNELLVSDLGAQEYAVREEAEAEILQRGADILPLLNDARRSPDLEVRLRAATLYQQLSRSIRRENFERFLAMDENVQLMGWEQFKKRHGDGLPTRKLYVEMLKSEWDTIATLETQPQLIDYLLFQRANKLREEMYGPRQSQVTEGSAAAIMHATSFEEIRITPTTMEQMKLLVATPQLTESLQDPERSAPLLSVFDRWLETNLEAGRFTDEMRFIVLSTCLREGISSGKIVAKQMLEQRASPAYQNGFGQFGAINANQQMMYAILAIAKLGGKEDIDQLKEYLDDKTEVSLHSVQGDQFKTQLRDVALVGVLHLSGEDPKDYGFPRITNDPNFLYSIRSIGFTAEEQRDNAFRKWAQYEAEKSS